MYWRPEEIYEQGYKREVLARDPHLLENILRIQDSFGVPGLVEKPGDGLRYVDRFNIIYPVGDPIFIHAFTLEGAGSSNYLRKYYVVEPDIPSKELIEAVEDVFAIVSGEYGAPEDSGEKRELIEKILERIITPVNREKGYFRAKG